MDEIRTTTLLGRSRYVLLTTFRRDGRPVPTPIWLAPDGDRLVVFTGSATGKVKRIRHTGRVLLAPCTARGRRLGADVEGSATLVPFDPALDRAMKAKYGVQYRFVHLVEAVARRLGREIGDPTGIALRVVAPL